MKNPYNELTKWAEAYFKQKELKFYRGLELSNEFKKDVEEAKEHGVELYIDPMLPVDLVVVEPKREVNEETNKKETVFHYQLFWVIDSENKNLEKRLLFYQFYLSRITETYRVKNTMIISTDCGENLRKKTKEIAKRYKFGLWVVDINKNSLNQVVEPKTFRDRMVEEFRDPSDIRDPFPESIQKEANNIAQFFDVYIRDAVETMIGITPEQLGKRYIDRRVLDTVFDLEKVSYRDDLRELVSQHLSQKDNDYVFVSNTFTELWKKCDLKIDYSNFLRDFEPALQNIYAGEKIYRDHYLHQFQVFLLGLHIIDKFHNKFPPQIDKQWLVASSFHDMGYPVQRYDIWSKIFFEKILRIKEAGALDLKTQFVDQSLLSCTGYIINSLYETYFKKEPPNWLADEKELIKFFYEKITNTNKKHHCIISGISLLKQALDNKEIKTDSSLFKEVFVPAARAITLHHEVVWRELLNVKKVINKIEFKNDPLTLLLLYCDCVQEWGRPSASANEESIEKSIEESKKNFFLKDIGKSKSKYCVTIWTPYLDPTKDIFREKEKEINQLNDCLSASGMLEICLADNSGKKIHSRTY